MYTSHHVNVTRVASRMRESHVCDAECDVKFIFHADGMMTWQPNVNQPCSTPPPLWRSYHHITLRGFVPKLKQWILFNWRCQNVALYIQIREIGRDFDDSQFFVTNGVSDVKISVWRCE